MEICYNTSCSAGVAHLVERHLAKVEVASSSLVTRSRKREMLMHLSFLFVSVYKINVVKAAEVLYNKIANF